jgi:hypothetical protein
MALPLCFSYLPELGTNLVTTLSRLNMNNLSHLEEEELSKNYKQCFR